MPAIADVKEPVAEVPATVVAEAKPKTRRPRKVKVDSPPTVVGAEGETSASSGTSESE
jgi:hypothetical protein